MKIENMHIHSEYSWDCKTKLEDIALGLIDSHINYGGICDHIEFNYETLPYVLTKFKIRNAEIDELNEKYNGKIKLLKGAEISSPHLYKELVDEINCLDFDYLIGSIHKIDRKAKTDEEKIIGTYNYYKEILKMVEANQVDVFGHIDYINRYYKQDYSDSFIIEEIFNIINENNKIIEINTSALKRTDNLYTSFPNIEKIAKYASIKKEISIGTDAHKLEELNYMLEENNLIVSQFKLKPVVFEKRKMIKLWPPTYS